MVSNAVGYNTVTIDKQYAILAVNFDGVSGGAMSIQDAVPYVTGMTTGGSMASADNIQIMQGDGSYKIYYMSNGKVGKKTYDTVGKWVCTDDATTAATDTIASGTAFWFVSQNGAATPYAITVAGSVLMTSSDTRDINKTYTLVASPYPVEIPLNDGVVVATGATQGGSMASADSIQIMQGDGSYKIYYLSNGKVGKKTYDTVGKWVCTEDNTVSTTDRFPVGKGAWFVSMNGDAKLQFVNPTATAE